MKTKIKILLKEILNVLLVLTLGFSLSSITYGNEICGFDKMYDNQSARYDELVTRAEALKLALSVIFNTDKLDGYSEKDEEYPNTAWVNYAEQYHKENCGIVKALEVRLSKTSVYPGDSFAVFVSNTDLAENFSVTAPFYNEPTRFYAYEDGFVGLIPVYAWSTPGKYQIQVSDIQTKLLTTLDVKILPKTFDVQYLKVSKSTAAINTTNNSEKDQVYFDAARANPIQEKLWEGTFIQPAKGRITTDYCATRYTNDNPTPSRHLAIDIANNTGTPIMASNNGKVVLAKKLIITGNTIVIDHGLGVFTSSFHLSKILVKEKDFVKKGDVIGKMGSTGYSTGPHLHFAIWKDGTFLNPWTFFEKDPIEFK
ncbi:MAG: uncharacterized protein K0S71_2263 [Clostridia bacterium]|nr:uncharacterized protein [Clostridia bacterium]